MPISAELYEQIRKFFVEGVSIRGIARELGCSRHTVRKYCEGAHLPERKPELQPRKASLRDIVYPRLKYYLELNEELPKKQRMSGHTIWLNLTREGYTMSESTVRRWIGELKREAKKAFVPLEFEAGEAMQVDWGQAYAYIGGVRTLIHCFCAVLPHSYALHVSVFPDETTECFFLGHQQAFEFLGGVPKICIYDNLRTAVFSGSGKKAVLQDRFERFAAHHAFVARLCSPYAGWEKGGVENVVSIVRRIAFGPMPRVENWHELQELITSRCLAYCETHKVKRRKLPIKQAWEQEKEHLRPMPIAKWDPSIEVKVLVHSDATCAFQTNRYSVPTTLAGRTITLKASPFLVRFFSSGKEVATHSRSYDKHQTFYNPEHYLSLLEQKPGAIDNAAPLRSGTWPPEIQVFKERYKKDDLHECLVAILRLFQKHPRDLVLKAVAWSNSQNEPSFELVLHFLDITQDPAGLDEHIQINSINLTAYDVLLDKECE